MQISLAWHFFRLLVCSRAQILVNGDDLSSVSLPTLVDLQ